MMLHVCLLLQGSVIGALYKSGKEFCLKRNFQCEPTLNKRCFTVLDLDISNGSRLVPTNTVIIGLSSVIALVFREYYQRTASEFTVYGTLS